MNRLTDGEEVIREHLRSLRQSEAALNALEKENTELHDKVNLLIQEKGAITRELEKTKVSQLESCYGTRSNHGLGSVGGLPEYRGFNWL